ncbi:HdeD family acid-resistance protein [Flammeovirga kamogawensis]|uniref:DUF308 domain-containing protein n=1 Tax=Flammeovirga kamogawensis TaxID=373891 RepID=A0ABX8H1M0_9BACT|nr:DUF308 domain-containing protein [Flammeovirga kamogawensis]MBB6463570.1 uncharacterized membrane protein HdeD (DUF308 family) [Flammeovirga kamogawensis]QWG09796.1 DUF308 domain-containing protein [Flammeovirga kamogawensis]TRX65304.1 hypothetical protein EO216_22540 [Flammeovirga kamogawensis]
MNHLSSALKYNVKHWYYPLISGLLLIGLGAWTVAHLLETFVSLSYLFSITFLAVGTGQMFTALDNRKSQGNWGWSFTGGMFTTILGIILISNPAMSLTTLPLYLGFYVLIKGLETIGKSIEYKDVSNSWGLLMFSGIVGLLLGFIIITNMTFASLTATFWFSLALFNAGISEFIVASKLKSIKEGMHSKK